jgi:hypothetical protein
MLGQTLVHQTQPVIQRHSLASLAVAAALGADLTVALSAARPWASHQIQRQAGPWKDRIAALLWSQLTATPVQMALAGALTAWLADCASKHGRSPAPFPADAAAKSVHTTTRESGASSAAPA